MLPAMLLYKHLQKISLSTNPKGKAESYYASFQSIYSGQLGKCRIVQSLYILGCLIGFNANTLTLNIQV